MIHKARHIIPIFAVGAITACSPGTSDTGKMFAVATERPRTGVIVQVRYAVRDGHTVAGSEIQETITFRDTATHRKTRRSDRPESVNVQADTSWRACAGWNRVLENQVPSRCSYPEELRETLESLFLKHSPEPTTWKGWKCWRYSWHEKETRSGCMLSPAQDVTYWVLADSQFPLVLRYESSLGSRMETRELRLNIDVPESLFKRPADKKLLIPITAPNAEFRVDARRERTSKRYGWTILSKETFFSTGRGSEHTYTSDHLDRDGAKTSTFTAPVSSLDATQTQIEICRLLQFDFGAGSFARREKILGLTADVIVEQPEPGVKVTRWIVDHPDFGTICVKSVRESDAETERMEVIGIRVSGVATGQIP
jgi:hypothetical protein